MFPHFRTISFRERFNLAFGATTAPIRASLIRYFEVLWALVSPQRERFAVGNDRAVKSKLADLTDRLA